MKTQYEVITEVEIIGGKPFIVRHEINGRPYDDSLRYNKSYQLIRKVHEKAIRCCLGKSLELNFTHQ